MFYDKKLKKTPLCIMITGLLIILLVLLLQGCNSDLDEQIKDSSVASLTLTSNQVDENSKIEQKLFTALVADYGMSGSPGIGLFREIDYNKLSPIKTNTNYKKEKVDKTRSVEWNGKFYEVEYWYSSKDGYIPFDYYIYEGNDKFILNVKYIGETTNICSINHNRKIKKITNPLSEVEQKQIVDKYISQYIDINDYLVIAIGTGGDDRIFTYAKPVNGIPSDDRYVIYIDGNGIIFTFTYFPQNVGKYDNLNIDSINYGWVTDKVTERINELYVNSQFEISNISMVNTILSISNDGQKYIYCQAKFDCHDKNTQEFYSTPFISFIILLD